MRAAALILGLAATAASADIETGRGQQGAYLSVTCNDRSDCISDATHYCRQRGADSIRALEPDWKRGPVREIRFWCTISPTRRVK